MNVLNFLRRRGGSDAEGRTPPPQQVLQQTSQQRPSAAKRPDKSEDGTADPAGDFLPSRRQASQVNLNKYLAGAPTGLTAMLKKPSRGDILSEQADNAGRAPSPNAEDPPQLQQSQQDPEPQLAPREPGYEPSMRGRAPRERRKSVSLAELAQGVQNLDVSQAALIMMPARLKAELGQQAPQLAAAIAGVSSSGQLPMISRSAGFPVGSLHSALSGSVDASINASAPGGLGSGAALTAARGFDRKPSIIREAMKQQQQQQVPGRAGQQPDAGLRSHGPNLSGDLGLMQLAAALAGQGPERPPGQRTTPPPERRSSMLQQQGLGPISRVSVNGGIAGAGGVQAPQPVSSQAAAPSPSPGAQPVAPHGSARRSDPGEGFRNRSPAPAPIDVVISNARGLNRPWAPGTDEGTAGPGPCAPAAPAALSIGGGKSVKDMRPAAAVNGRSEGVQESEGLRPGIGGSGSLSGEVRLPKVSGPRLSSAMRDKERERDAAGAPTGIRASTSAADLAAMTEAMAAYQSEAGRLRASALRRVDTKIKRAVMERHMGPEPGYTSSLLSGAHDSNALTPTLRSQAQVKPRLAITPPPQPPSQPKLTPTVRAPQFSDGQRMGTPPGGTRPRLPESDGVGPGDESLQMLPRNGISGPRPPVEPMTEGSVHRRR